MLNYFKLSNHMYLQFFQRVSLKWYHSIGYLLSENAKPTFLFKQQQNKLFKLLRFLEKGCFCFCFFPFYYVFWETEIQFGNKWQLGTQYSSSPRSSEHRFWSSGWSIYFLISKGALHLSYLLWWKQALTYTKEGASIWHHSLTLSVLCSQEFLHVFLLFCSPPGEDSAYCLLLWFAGWQIKIQQFSNQESTEKDWRASDCCYSVRAWAFLVSTLDDSINVNYCQCVLSAWRRRLNLLPHGKLFWLQDLIRYLSYSDKWAVHFSKWFDWSHSKLIY